MAIAIPLLVVLDVILLAVIGLVLRNGARLRSLSFSLMKWTSVAVTTIGLLSSPIAPNAALWALASVASGCLLFLAGYHSAWLSDRAFRHVERQRDENVRFRELMDSNWYLRTIWRLTRWQRRG